MENLKPIIAKLRQEATARVSAKAQVEQRWLADLRRYYGQYSSDELQKMKKNEGSQIFVNMTGPKTDAMSAKMYDLLFPTEERNWSIEATPVPQLAEVATQAIEAEIAAEVQGNPQGVQDATEIKATVEQIQDEATKRAEKMSRVMADQLDASSYNATMRDVVDDACQLGTGIVKGPVVGNGIIRKWKQGEEGFKQEVEGENNPGFERVDPWGFFPPMNRAKVENCDGFYVRHLMTPKDLRNLSKRPDFRVEAIRDLLKVKNTKSAPSFFADVQNLSGAESSAKNEFYHVWEYSGEIDPADMQELMKALDPELAEDFEADPLEHTHAVVWFCNDEILKFALYPMDSGEALYSVFNLKRDQTSLFGFGIPHLMDDPQEMLNAATRMMMDNSGFSAGPHILIDDSLVEPADGTYSMRGPKIWRAKQGITRDNTPFNQYRFDSNQAELANIMLIAKTHMEEETSLSKLSMGDGQDTPQSKTLGGTAMLLNASNVIFRRMVRNFDDDMTVPNIRRLFDWNMQFGTDEEIKGDFGVKARGVSTFLLREIQAQNLTAMNLQYAGHPIFGPMLKHRALMRETIKANMLPVDTVMLSDDEIDAMQKKMAEQPPEASGDTANAEADMQLRMAELDVKRQQIELQRDKLDADVAIAQMKRETDLQLAGIKVDVEMTKVAEHANIAMDKMEFEAAMEREERELEAVLGRPLG